jgi:hypothetical protein
MIFNCVCVMVLELGTEQGSAVGSPEKTARWPIRDDELILESIIIACML